MSDVFAVQDEIAAAVVGELKIKLLGAAAKSRETDPRSYELFLQARDLSRKGTPAASQEAIAKYQQALEIDPENTAALVSLANVYWIGVWDGSRPPEQGAELARNLLAKALARDSEDASAHSLLAMIAVAYDLDYSQAVRHVERAVARAPRDPDVVGAAGYVARRLGRLEQAIAEFQKELVLSPESIAVHAPIAEVRLQKGDTKSALREVESEPDEQWRLPVLSMVYHALGRRSESDAALAELTRKYEHTGSFAIATALAFWLPFSPQVRHGPGAARGDPIRRDFSQLSTPITLRRTMPM